MKRRKQRMRAFHSLPLLILLGRFFIAQIFYLNNDQAPQDEVPAITDEELTPLSAAEEILLFNKTEG